MPQGLQNHVAFLKGGNANNVAVGLRKHVEVMLPVVAAAAGNTDYYLMAPEDGVLDSLEFSFVDALLANDTNYLTFTALNLGQDGLGNMVMTNPTQNTTRVNGGSGITANGRKKVVLSSTSSQVGVWAGDRIRVRITVTGTLANTLTGGVLLARFRG